MEELRVFEPKGAPSHESSKGCFYVPERPRKKGGLIWTGKENTVRQKLQCWEKDPRTEAPMFVVDMGVDIMYWPEGRMTLGLARSGVPRRNK
jgi:hypothetical protein